MSQEETKKHIGSTLTTPRAVIIAGCIIAFALFITRGSSSGTALQGATDRAVEAGGSSQGLVNEVSDEDFIQGAKNPKVTIVEFSDFGCSFCASFHPTLQKIVDAYPNDVAWVFRHLPFRNMEAALASECVGQTLGDEAFWSYGETLFTYYPDITREVLASEAVKLGFESEEDFWECQGSEQVAARVDATAAEARLIGAQGTPHSLILTKDGQVFPLRGASSFEQVDQIISLLLD